MPIGPHLPPSAEKRKRTDDEESSDSDDDVGPQLPPPNQEESQAKRQRTIGPSLPPTTVTKDSRQPDNGSASDDDDDDDFGPSLPSKDNQGTTNDTTKQARNAAFPPITAAPETQSKRDEWMTLAPTSNDWSQRVDPTKLKNRKFNTGRSTSTPSSGTGSGDIWHETPDQKQARLKRQVLGIKDSQSHSTTTTTPTSSSSTTEPNTETAQRLKEYNKNRGPSLYSAHQKNHDTADEDDLSSRAFDREKDMAVGGGLQLNSTQRRDMLKKSADFNSRFSSAKYL